MIVTNTFIYFRVQKCASRYIGEYFKLLYDSKSNVAGNHKPAGTVIHDKEFVASIRNPYKWYVSWYNFAKNEASDRFRHLFYKDNTLRSFEEFMLFVMNKDQGKFPAIDFEVMKKLDIGVFTYRYLRIACQQPLIQLSKLEDATLVIDRWLNVETLGKDIAEFIKQHPSYNADNLEQCDRLRRFNRTEKVNYKDYYASEEIRQLVASKDSFIIENHGYELT